MLPAKKEGEEPYPEPPAADSFKFSFTLPSDEEPRTVGGEIAKEPTENKRTYNKRLTVNYHCSQVQAGLEGGVTHSQTVTNEYIESLVNQPAEFTLLDAEDQEVGKYKAKP